MLQARPWLVHCGTESWPARTPWVSPVGGNRSHSEGGSVLVLSRKGKEDCPELLTLLAVIPKETCSTLAWFLAPGSGECPFSSGKICARTNGPPERKTPLRGSTRKQLWYDQRRRVHPPIARGWVAGAKYSRRPPVEREESKNAQIRKEKQQSHKNMTKVLCSNNYSILEY